jgi:hypothetical protein
MAIPTNIRIFHSRFVGFEELVGGEPVGLLEGGTIGGGCGSLGLQSYIRLILRISEALR